MRQNEYPNLGLIEYIFASNLVNSKGAKNVDIDMEVFPQWWDSTATAFGGVGGSAMTKAYTVVAYDSVSQIYGVFIGNRPCYIVENANEKFLEDLKNRSIASYEEAGKLY